MTRQRSIVCLLFLMILSGVGQPAAAACLFNVDVLKYQQYLPENLCPNDNEDGCLEPTSYIATRSDGRRVRVRGVYRWYHENAIWEDADRVSRVHLLPHFILEYMRLLRDAYSVCPDLYGTQLFNQIDYVVSQAVMRNYPDSVIPALVWENRYGITQGMEQAEMANFFAATARKYSKHGAPEARGTMRYALHAIQSLFIPAGVRTGGVRSIVTTPCGAKRARLRPCFWFHSRGVGIDTDAAENPEDREDRIGTVLNQHLHVVTDILWMSKEVSRARHLVPRELGGSETLLARLEDRAIGGLYQLAFSRGNNSAAPTRPPNIAQFMRHDTDVPSFPFYFSWYRLDLTERTFDDITLAKTCHYHTHSLAKMKNIKEALDANVDLFAKSPTNQGWRLYEAVDRLFAGFGEPMGMSGSTNAIWQFWLAEQYKYTPAVGCPRCVDKNNKVVACEGDNTVANYYSQIW